MRWEQMNSKISVLIPAAGAGHRMETSIKKPYLLLNDKPILSHTIDLFENNSAIDDIYVIVNKLDIDTCNQTVITPYRYKKVKELIEGGDTRQTSVFNGLCRLPDDVDYVIVHDGVRPFLNEEIIFECLAASEKWGAAVSAVPVKDTIKIAGEEQFIHHTPDRNKLWRVQTPQVFRKSLLLEAYESAIKTGITASDDAGLVEELGYPVKLVMGSYKNIKLTTPEDMQIAEVWHNNRI